MRTPKQLLEQNRKWADSIKADTPDFFTRLAKQQSPKYLWIGCSDSRVPATQITDLQPGEVFVHRNIANVVVHSDVNCFSVIQYAVDVLQVNHIIVCGHYNCGGVQASMEQSTSGLIDSWLSHIRDVFNRHQEKLDAVKDKNARIDLLCELNVIEQVGHVCSSHILKAAWDRGQDLSVHGWIYRLEEGLIKDLNVTHSGKQL